MTDPDFAASIAGAFQAFNERRFADFATYVTGVVEVDEHYPDGSVWNDVFIFKLRDGLVASMTAYFGEPFPAPEWGRPYRVQPSGR